MKLRACFVIVSFLSTVICTTLAQTAAPDSSSASIQVPRLIKFSGIAQDQARKPVTGMVGVTFSLYKDQQGGSPLWVETQNVQADATGHYTAMLGSASTDGVPLSLFSSVEAHWISTQISGQREQPRVLLLSVPYALKAADAETLGGLPASAFIHANPSGVLAKADSQASSAKAGTIPPAGITGKGEKNFVPLWTGATTLGSSVIYQTGGHVGVGTKTPGAEVDSVSAGIAIRGTSSGATGTGVSGNVTSSSGVNYGVFGQTASTTNGAAGVSGFEGATKGQVIGVVGVTNSTSNGATGVSGFEGATAGAVYGVSGGTNSSANGAVGVIGYNNATSGVVAGVVGTTASSSGSGVSAAATAATGNTNGVYAQSASTNGTGAVGYASATSGPTIGVFGVATSPSGAGGIFTNLAGGTAAVIVGNGANSTPIFVVDASGNGHLAGNLNVTGKLTKGSGSFKIDHPLDPANKYLSHSFVESPDMMNLYNGLVTLDAHGSAWITMPDYFEALNRDFRYQLTSIGRPQPSLYVGKELAGNRFQIAGGKPGGKVSWQVTGIRHDAYANANRIPTEEDKPAAEQGHYLHPEVFGQPASKSIQAASRESSATDQLAKVSNP